TGNILRDLDATPNGRGPFGYLQLIAIRDAQLTLDDRALGATWQARSVHVNLTRGLTGLAGDARLVLATGDQEAPIHLDYRYIDAEQRFTGNLTFADLEPARFAAAAPGLARLAALKLPITGKLGFNLDLGAMRMEATRGELTIGSGRIEEPHLAGGSLPVA